MTEDDRIKVTGGLADSGHPDYPYSRRADLSDIWVVAGECDIRDGEPVDADAVAWGTAGEYVDHVIEVSEIGQDEVRDLIAAMKGKGSYVLLGGVGTGVHVRRVDGPEAAIAYGSPAPTP